MRPVDRVLGRAENARKAGDGWLVSCPLPEHGKGCGDKNPSVSISEGDDGRALVRCKAGCETEAVVSAWGLTMANLFKSSNGHRKKSFTIPSKTTATLQPCNLENYAAKIRLPVEFLEDKCGLSERNYQGKPAVRIPYRDLDGTEAAARFRIALEKSEEVDDRFKWRSGSKTRLYGLWRLEGIRKASYVVLVEGESAREDFHFGEPISEILFVGHAIPEPVVGYQVVGVDVDPSRGPMSGRTSSVDDAYPQHPIGQGSVVVSPYIFRIFHGIEKIDQIGLGHIQLRAHTGLLLGQAQLLLRHTHRSARGSPSEVAKKGGNHAYEHTQPLRGAHFREAHPPNILRQKPTTKPVLLLFFCWSLLF